MIVLMVDKKRWSRKKKFVFVVVLIVVVVFAGIGGYLWYNHERYVSRIKYEEFSVAELSQPNNDISALVEKRTGKPIDQWQKKKLTKRSFVTAKEAIYVGQALLVKNDTERALAAYGAAEQLGSDSDKTYLFYVDYGSIAVASGKTSILTSLEQKAHAAIKNSHSMSATEKTIMNEYVAMKFKNMRGES